MPRKVTAGDCGTTRAHDGDRACWAGVDEHETLWACVKVMPMGWSRPLFFRHSTVTDAQAVAEMRGLGEVAEMWLAQECRGIGSPRRYFSLACPPWPPYIDNAFLM